jgi:uncharacterized Zn-binding protein involved in type VI secretion
MPAVQRVGDKNSAGGAIQQGDSTVLVNGKAIAIPNAVVSSHPPYGRGTDPHHHTKTKSSKNSTVTVNGQPIVITGDTDTCGHPRVGGSPDVTIG